MYVTANQLSAAVSSALSVTEEDAVTAHSKSAKFPSVSTTQLQTIATSLNNHLSQLLVSNNGQLMNNSIPSQV